MAKASKQRSNEGLNGFMTRTILPLMIVAILGGCTTLPRDGPSGRSVDAGATRPDAMGGYALVELNYEVSERIKAVPPQFFGSLTGAASERPLDLIGVGDALQVQIIEPSGTLFGGGVGAGSSVQPGNQVLPAQVVDRSGAVSIPFAGAVRVEGLTPPQAAAAIRRALAGKVANPQITVVVAENASNSVTVLGDVRQPGRKPLSVNSNRLLDVLGEAGGSERPVDDMMVTIQRAGQTYAAPLGAVTTSFEENVRLQPGDLINFAYKPRRFSTFGALGAVAQVDMPPGPVTLAGALSRVSGLNTNTANASRVMIFRFERPEVARALGVTQPATPNGVPIIYQLDFNNAANVFAASNIQIMPEDVIYVPLANAAEARKFFEFVQSITRVIYDVSVTSAINVD